MFIGTGYTNISRVSRNYDMLSKLNTRFKGMPLKDLDANGSGKIHPLSAEELEALRQQEMTRPKTLKVDSNEIVDNVYTRTGSNTTYEIEGITFTNEEMQNCKRMVKSAISGLPKKGSSLDYKDYALMGIASSMVDSYAEENLTTEQAEIVNKSMKGYLDGLVQAEKESQDGNGCYTNNTEGVGSTGELNKYYSTRSPLGLSQEAVDDFKRMIAYLPEGTRNRLFANLDSAQTKGSVLQSASNYEYAESIKNVFQEADLRDDTSVDIALEQYQKLMTPVYKAAGLQNLYGNQALAGVLGRDMDIFLQYISNMKAAAGDVGSKVDYKI